MTDGQVQLVTARPSDGKTILINATIDGKTRALQLSRRVAVSAITALAEALAKAD